MSLRFVPLACTAALLLSSTATLVSAQTTPAADATVKAQSLIANGDFQADENKDGNPDKWGAPKGPFSYPTEGDNRFLRIVSTEPDKLALYYQPVKIPEGVKALEMTWKQRITDLKTGDQAWFDARIMMNWKDAEDKKMPGAPKAPNARKNTEGWVERTTKFAVPEGARMLEWMPCLFRVKAGTYDLDDIVLKPIELAELETAAKDGTVPK